MVDVDGVVCISPDGRNWAADLEADLGLSPETLQHAFFAPHFGDVIRGRAGLHERLAPDKSANVEAARAAGWGGDLWDGTGRLAEVLARAGVRLP